MFFVVNFHHVLDTPRTRSSKFYQSDNQYFDLVSSEFPIKIGGVNENQVTERVEARENTFFITKKCFLETKALRIL